MTCKHERTTVLHSRKQGAIQSEGKTWYGKRDFALYATRRRRCLDCDFRTTTVEVDLAYMDELKAGTDIVAIRARIAEDIKTFLLSSDASEHSQAVEP